MVRPMKRLCLGLTLLAFAACSSGTDTTLQLSSYDTACNVQADCAAAFVGDPCATTCECPNAAINRSDLPREQSDLMAMTALCNTPPGACTVSCVEPMPTCNAGVCALP